VSERTRLGSKSALKIAVAAILCLSGMGCAEKVAESELAQLLPGPDSVRGASAMGEIAEYEGETLYDFLNGGAEIYFDYGILSIASAEYRTSDGKSVEVSIYDMGSAAGAFGIYSNVRYSGAEFVAVGNEGMLTLSSLDFWKGKFYCRLLTFDMEPQTQAVMLDLGKALAGGITDPGAVPDIVNVLPEENRVERSEKLFRGQIGLNNIRYVSSDNVFNLGGGTQGVAANYDADGTQFTLLVIEYASEDEATSALESSRALAAGEGVVIERSGNRIVVVWDMDEDRASAVIEKVRAELRYER
jgi:hypothetical protein